MHGQIESLRVFDQSTIRGRTTGVRAGVRGKSLFSGEEKLSIRGVTYGTFQPSASVQQFPTRDIVSTDSAAMAANGINAVRTYTVPPEWLLDEASEKGLHVMVGVPWDWQATASLARMAARCSGVAGPPRDLDCALAWRGVRSWLDGCLGARWLCHNGSSGSHAGVRSSTRTCARNAGESSMRSPCRSRAAGGASVQGVALDSLEEPLKILKYPAVKYHSPERRRQL